MANFRFTLILLAILSIIWGFGWPMVSLGLPYCPVLWYSTLRLVGGALLSFIVLGACGQLTWPTRKDLPLILSIGLGQIGLFILLMTLALQYLPPGRSALIAYLSPLFVTPIAIIWLGETLNWGKIAGLLLGMTGIVVLFGPWQMDWHNRHLLLGNGLMLINALIWAMGMLHVRYAKCESPAHTLLPWQLLIAIVPNGLAALIWAPHSQFIWHMPLIISLLYSIFLNTLAGYFLMTVITRRLPVVTSSLGLLAIPVVSLLSSVALGMEHFDKGMMVALGLILASLVFVTLGSARG